MIKRTSDYLNFVAKNEDDFQAILSVVGQAIERLPSWSTKAALMNDFCSYFLPWFHCIFGLGCLLNCEFLAYLDLKVWQCLF